MYTDVAHLKYQAEEDRWVWEERREKRERREIRQAFDPHPGYEVVLSGRPIPLEMAEFQLIKVLAQRPYHAFRVQEIIDALQSVGLTILDADELRGIVIELRNKLGFFRDYVQTVPYIGYRFRP